MRECAVVAQSLVAKYPFLKEHVSNTTMFTLACRVGTVIVFASVHVNTRRCIGFTESV